MRKNDTIQCANKEDVKQMLKDLSAAGFHAVVGGSSGLIITITGVPETEYLVQAADGHGRRQNAYCSTQEEAEEIYGEYCNSYAFAEILKGYPGEWESIAQSW